MTTPNGNKLRWRISRLQHELTNTDYNNSSSKSYQHGRHRRYFRMRKPFVAYNYPFFETLWLLYKKSRGLVLKYFVILKVKKSAGTLIKNSSRGRAAFLWGPFISHAWSKQNFLFQKEFGPLWRMFYKKLTINISTMYVWKTLLH
jgi:hypothetical protein